MRGGENIAEETITPKTLAGLKIQPVEQRSVYLNMLIYGDPGVGKTVLAGSADAVPAMRPVLFVDVEGGTESLKSFHPEVEHVRVTGFNQLAQLYQELVKGKSGYETIVLDSLTEIQKLCMYEIMRQLIVARPDLDPDVPGMREYGKNLEQMRKFIRLFRDLPMHTIFTALAQSDKDQNTGKVTIKPQLTGKLINEAPAFLDIVGYYYIKTVKKQGQEGEDQLRLLLTKATEKNVAKDRSNKLPMVIESPSMPTIFEHIYRKDK